jgi:hypothetical protein
MAFDEFYALVLNPRVLVFLFMRSHSGRRIWWIFFSFLVSASSPVALGR